MSLQETSALILPPGVLIPWMSVTSLDSLPCLLPQGSHFQLEKIAQQGDLFKVIIAVQWKNCSLLPNSQQPCRIETLLPLFLRAEKYKLTKMLTFTFTSILLRSLFANPDYLFDSRLGCLSQQSWFYPSRASVPHSLWTGQDLSQTEPVLPSCLSLSIFSAAAVCYPLPPSPTCHLPPALQLN